MQSNVAVIVVMAASMRGDIPNSRTSGNTDSFQEPTLSISFLSHSAGRSLRLCVIYLSYTLLPRISRGRMVMSSHKKQDVLPSLLAQRAQAPRSLFWTFFRLKAQPLRCKALVITPDTSFLVHECILSITLYCPWLSCNSNCE